MDITKGVACFHSKWEHYKHELDGSKPYTVRRFTDEREQIAFAEFYHRWESDETVRIRITCRELTPDDVPVAFGREVSHILFMGYDILAGQEYIIAWRHPSD